MNTNVGCLQPFLEISLEGGIRGTIPYCRAKAIPDVSTHSRQYILSKGGMGLFREHTWELLNLWCNVQDAEEHLPLSFHSCFFWLEVTHSQTAGLTERNHKFWLWCIFIFIFICSIVVCLYLLLFFLEDGNEKQLKGFVNRGGFG